MSAPMRIVFFSEINSKLGAPFLAPLAEHPQTDLVGLVTSEPGKLCTYFLGEPDPVDLQAEAAARGIPVLHPYDVNAPGTLSALSALNPDYFLVCNYQQIFKKALLAIPTVTSINFHPSPLPRYAGLAPFYWMIRGGERDGTVSAIEMTPGIDAGPLITQRPMPLTGRETTLALRTAQERLNVDMLLDLIPHLADQSFTRTPQDLALRTYFGRPTDDDHRIDFTQDAESVDRVVRASYRRPGAWTTRPDGRRLIVLSTDPGPAASIPLAAPGTVHHTEPGILVAGRDAWLHVRTIDHDGHEVPAEEYPQDIPQGTLLGDRTDDRPVQTEGPSSPGA